MVSTALGNSSFPGLANYGIKVDALYGTVEAIGGFFNAKESTGRNVGVWADARNSPNTPNTECYGVYSYADGLNTGSNLGVVGYAKKGTARSIGVAGIVNDITNYPISNIPVGLQAGIYGNQGIGSYAGYFDGDVMINGIGNANPGGVFTSDQMFKTNVDSLTNVISILKLLKPRSYYFDTTNVYGLNFTSKKQFGFIAQDVQPILPALISSVTKPETKDSLGSTLTQSVTYKALNYDAFFAFLVKGIQEQQHTIDSILNVLSASASARIIEPSNNSTTTNGTILNKQNVTLTNTDAIVLDQNQPNPFSESTVIKYNVPEKYGYAQLIFSTLDGRILKTIDIAKKGAGEITVFANDLTNGIYSYTLVVDGKTFDTKKMVKQN